MLPLWLWLGCGVLWLGCGVLWLGCGVLGLVLIGLKL